mgnify:CR=1 FL=1
MRSDLRRENIISILENSDSPVSGSELARRLSVSRQVIVNDISLLRAKGNGIVSTTQGYTLEDAGLCERIFKVKHTEDEAENELNLFVDYGAIVKDVFVSHRAFGTIRAEMNIRSRLDVQNYMESIRSGRSTLLSSTTDGYHYHTVQASSMEILDMIEEKLWEMGYLARPLEYEPDEFIKNVEKHNEGA